METRTIQSLKKQAGVTLVQVMLGLAVIGGASVIAFNQFTGVQQSAVNQSGYDELASWVAAATTVSLLNGFANTDVDNAAAFMAETQFSSATNVYAEDITIADTGGNIVISYPVVGNDQDAAEANCALIQSRFENADGDPVMSSIESITDCTAANPSILVITVD